MLRFTPATNNDSKLILRYIKKLAVSENFPFQVTVTQADIEKNLLSNDAKAKALLLSIDENPCGFAVYYYTFSTTTGKLGLHLDDLYVEPNFQGMGIGKKTLQYLAKIAKKNNCARFEWWALKTNDSAIKLYLNLGAKQLKEIVVFRLEKDQINDLANENHS